MRAIQVATAEKRRLHDALFRGARKPKSSPADVVADAVDEVAPETIAEAAWRIRIWQGEGPSYEELTRLHGPPGWSPLLHREHEEWASWCAIAAEYPTGRVPSDVLGEHLAQFAPHMIAAATEGDDDEAAE